MASHLSHLYGRQCGRGGGSGSDAQHTVGVTEAIGILRLKALRLLHHHVQDHNGGLTLGGNKNWRTFYIKYLFATGNSQKMFMNFLADSKGFLGVGNEVSIHFCELRAAGPQLILNCKQNFDVKSLELK